MHDYLFVVRSCKSSTRPYKEIMSDEGMAAYFGRPEYLTLVFLSVVPEEKILSERAISRIEREVDPLLREQCCRQFGDDFSFRNFLDESRRLSRESRIHCFAHLLIHYAPTSLKRERGRKTAIIKEHVVTDGKGNLGIAFDQKFDGKFVSLVSFLWERYNLLLDGRVDRLIPPERREIGLLGRILRRLAETRAFLTVPRSTAP